MLKRGASRRCILELIGNPQLNDQFSPKMYYNVSVLLHSRICFPLLFVVSPSEPVKTIFGVIIWFGFDMASLIFRTRPLEDGPPLASACPADAKTTK
jgi:hypothetical protein